MRKHIRSAIGLSAILALLFLGSVATAQPLGFSSQHPGVQLVVVKQVLRLEKGDVVAATASFDRNGLPAVAIKLAPKAAKRLLDLTKSNLGQQMLLVVGKRILTAPVIQALIASGDLLLTGRFTIAETQAIAKAIAKQYQ